MDREEKKEDKTDVENIQKKVNVHQISSIIENRSIIPKKKERSTVTSIYELIKLGLYTKRAQEDNTFLWISLRFAIMILHVSCSVGGSYPYGKFVSAMTNYDAEGFFFYVLVYVCIAGACAPIEALEDYVSKIFEVKLGACITYAVVGKYMSYQSFYKIISKPEIDNPGQRLSDDVRQFCSSIEIMVNAAGSQFLRMLGYSIVLWTISPVLLYGIIVFSTVLTFTGLCIFGKKAAQLKKSKIEQKADYRASIINIRLNAESIAFYDGGNQEREWVTSIFGDLLETLHIKNKWDSSFWAFSTCVYYTTSAIPYMLLSPKIFDGSIPFGQASQAQYAFLSISHAIQVPFKKLPKLTTLHAVSKRIFDVLDACDNFKKEAKENINIVRSVRKGDLVISNLSIHAPPPEATPLIKDLQICVEENSDSLLICGPSGSGKSSLLRTLAGLWNHGSGKIELTDKTMFLPQEPYIPKIPHENTLKAQLLFPYNYEIEPSDDEIITALKQVQLDQLLNRSIDEGIYAKENWNLTLSIGEKQRLAFARILLTKPRMIFLDEGTSALDEINEMKAYKLIAGLENLSFISVAHHPKLAQYHKKILYLNGDTTWKIMTPKEYEAFVESELASNKK